MMESTNVTKSLKRLVELETICEKQSEHISKLEQSCKSQVTRIGHLANKIVELKREKKHARYYAMEAESDLDVIQAAWCDFDAVVEALRAECDKLRKSKDICPVCMTWSWAPCDEGDERAEQRGEEWVLCQCCNDSRIAVLWKGRADKLQEKCETLMVALKKYPEAAIPGTPLHGERTRGIEDAHKAIKATLGKGDKK